MAADDHRRGCGELDGDGRDGDHRRRPSRLAMSYHLAQRGREHVVLERARVAERWRSERWDSLRFQFPNWSLALPGQAYAGDEPDGFAHKDEVVRFIERYALRIAAPMRSGADVTALRCAPSGVGFELTTSQGRIAARHVVVATGPYQRPRLPRWSRELPADIVQLHARDYRRPQALPDGAVVVIGSGASGCQIADELLAAGRRTSSRSGGTGECRVVIADTTYFGGGARWASSIVRSMTCHRGCARHRLLLPALTADTR